MPDRIQFPLNKAMIVIAVSQYGGEYADLPGTLTGADRIARWAEQPGVGRGYNVLEINDGGGDLVTIERLRGEIEPFLASQMIDRLVVYFAGHGAIKNLSESFWLLTGAARDGNTREAVDQNAFKDGLARCGLGHHPELSNGNHGQLCFIVDACKTLNTDSLHLHGDPIVATGVHRKKLEIDLFFASIPGEEAFQPKATSNREAYCLFTDVLMDAFEGQVSAAVEAEFHRFAPIIDNQKLAYYVEKELPLRAQPFNVDARPDMVSMIRRDHNYYDVLPSLPVQPYPDRHLRDTEVRADRLATPGPRIPRRPRITAFRTSRSQPEAGQDGRPLATSIRDRERIAERASEAVSMGLASSAVDVQRGEFVQLLKRMKRAEGRAGSLFVSEASRMAVPKLFSRSFLSGAEYSDEAFAEFPLFIQQGENWLLVPRLGGSTVFVDHSMPGELFVKTNAGSELLFEYQWDLSFSSTAALIDLVPIRVRDASTFADEIRRGKASMPNNANVAGYLYDVVNDIDNIRRTAHIMAHDGILPIDLAILAGENLRWHETDNEGWFVTVDLPEVARDLSVESRSRPSYARSAFNEQQHVHVKGIMPIYRQGWRKLSQVWQGQVPDVFTEVVPYLLGNSAVLIPTIALAKIAKFFGYVIVEADDVEEAADTRLSQMPYSIGIHFGSFSDEEDWETEYEEQNSPATEQVEDYE